MKLQRARIIRMVEPHAVGNLGALFLAAIPVLIWPFGADHFSMTTAAVMMGFLGLALHLIGNGLALQNAHRADPSNPLPRLPYKAFGYLLIGLVVFVLAGHKIDGLLPASLCGILAAGLAFAAFGPDTLAQNASRAEESAVETDDSPDPAGSTAGQFDLIIGRVARLGDTDLTYRTESARDRVIARLRTAAASHAETPKGEKATAKLLRLLDAEVARLETQWDGSGSQFARTRYVAALDALVSAFENMMHRRVASPKEDIYDREADLLLNRMPRESAA
ncbi:hypothetical protein KUH32_09045 [Thalassococcus sp. CAU 1522]|uniref:Uncharacterized protein n=1 Tax=Thalassococcus arenae TaxID=2851652 RepID=A0ABS6N8J9_9RHOB|nr:hypothetical protein [Thalassococcus arenae]MBV2359919.1 hypothetical protein [Thalassococcus arenae]